MKRELRRIDRGVNELDAREILKHGDHGILSTCGPDGQPYGTPLNYCLIDNAIYFHCAVEGRKLENIAANDRASFCVVGATEILPDQFATRYESVIISGRTTEVFAGEKQMALEGLIDKYSADFREEGLHYIAEQDKQTRVFKVSIESICGKARR